jgi:hypothetical protein
VADSSAHESSGPRCRFHVEQGAEKHALVFKSRCNFEQDRIVIRPDAQQLGVDRTPRITRRSDPGDRFRCRGDRQGNRVLCHGDAGKGAEVVGLFETKLFSCQVRSRATILGGVDCDPPATACPLVAYEITKRARRAGDCG